MPLDFRLGDIPCCLELLQVPFSQLHLVFGRQTLVEYSIGGLNPFLDRCIVHGWFHENPLDQAFGRFSSKRAVHQEQGLRGNRGRRSLTNAHQVLWPVEEHHGRNQLTSLDKEVDASPSHLLVERSWAIHLRFELSRYREKCVAKCLRLQSPGIASPISCILRIFRDAIPRSVQRIFFGIGLTACTLGWS